MALGRKNSLFAGSDGGARHWAIVASPAATARLRGMSAVQRAAAVARLANLLTEAAGLVAGRRDDDQR